VRCSSSERLLVDFVEGALPPLRRSRLVAHLDGCERCSELLQELRVIDALLLQPRLLDPAPNFTFKTLAEARSLGRPRVDRGSTLGIVVTYLAFAWTIIGVWLLLGGTSARQTLASSGTALVDRGGLTALLDATSRLFGHATPGVTALMAGIVAIDVVAGVVLAVVYAAARPQLARRLARISETIG
jgi:anti-sigma factor RsiW